VVVLKWDTARAEVGCRVWTCEDPDGKIVVATFEPGDVHEAQVHIEATGGCVSLEAAARICVVPLSYSGTMPLVNWLHFARTAHTHLPCRSWLFA
jgi:hypothetical protein